MITREEFDARLSQLEATLDRHGDRIVHRLDAINGRVRENEREVAVLKDRDARELNVTRNSAARSAAFVAAIVGAAVSWIFGRVQ